MFYPLPRFTHFTYIRTYYFIQFSVRIRIASTAMNWFQSPSAAAVLPTCRVLLAKIEFTRSPSVFVPLKSPLFGNATGSRTSRVDNYFKAVDFYQWTLETKWMLNNKFHACDIPLVIALIVVALCWLLTILSQMATSSWHAQSPYD